MIENRKQYGAYIGLNETANCIGIYRYIEKYIYIYLFLIN